MNIAVQARLKHGELLRVLRRHNLSQRAFAKLIPTSPVTFGELINLKRRPGPTLIAKMDQALLRLGEDLDLEALWPPDFRGINQPKGGYVGYRDVDPQLLLAVSTPRFSTEQRLLLEQALNDDGLLDDRERKIVDGFLDGKTATESSLEIHRSRMRVAQLRRRAIAKISAYIATHDADILPVL